jgi:hypothetical protein
MEEYKKILLEISKIGKGVNSKPFLNKVRPFAHFFNGTGKLLKEKLDENDGPFTRREILTRYLLLNAVLDQGPDTEGIRRMLVDVTNELYGREIRIFHRPLDFFKEIGVAIDNILLSHKSIKEIRKDLWARENKSNPDKYNLFMDNSKQVLNYAIFRWGVPLSLTLLLEKDGKTLVDYIEKWDSGEIMSRQLKDNERYGLGKAIGDKASHLFAKWYIHSFNLTRNSDLAWGKLSFELPLDSNAGRILFRTGWLLNFTGMKELEEWNVIQKNVGKGKTHYIRVTNLRGNKSKSAYADSDIFQKYCEISALHLKTKKSPRSVEIQQIPNVLLLESDCGIGDLDDGLMYIGTNYCLNHETPKCEKCPIANLCMGHQAKPSLIKNYRT